MTDRILPTPEQLRQMLRYEPDTGKLFWTKCDFRTASWNGKYPGKEAIISDSGNGYLKGEVMRKTVYAHRVAWAIHYGEWPNGEIDHINSDGKDNRINNLRVATSSENSMNTRRHKDGSSGFKGVTWHAQRGKWKAQIFARGKQNHLGLFNTPEDAHAAYCEAAKKYHGEFARLE